MRAYALGERTFFDADQRHKFIILDLYRALRSITCKPLFLVAQLLKTFRVFGNPKGLAGHELYFNGAADSADARAGVWAARAVWIMRLFFAT